MLQTTQTPARQEATVAAPAGHYRWVIIGLLFVITTINYMDRNLLGVLKPTIQGDLHFSETDYGNIVFAFSMAYAAGYASMGAFSDRVGVRLGLAVAAMIWCAASGLAEVNCMTTLTAPLAAETSLTSPNEMISRE